eukprot:TRINITY_DN10330_c1_g1_i1.p1 TRINITY_DN10330_c1_g1~~TRINITY_DN10330_c1_g1_i1.p1  ORF type:complete len:468 (+),score=29.90 TRINITY_DN10330_c1_g1_i1:107-1510(+)
MAVVQMTPRPFCAFKIYLMFCLLIKLFAQDCSLSRIYNGNWSNIWRFTYAVSLQIPREDNLFLHRCGGTLIERNLVLTAAHCIWLDTSGGETDFREQNICQGNISKPLYAAIAPDCRHEEGWERIRVVRYYYPPSFTGEQPTKYGQDIAILVLEKDIREDMFPVIMQIDNVNKDNIQVGQGATTIGWGAQHEYETVNQQQYAENMVQLKSAEFQIIECNEETLISMNRDTESMDDFDQSMLCAVSSTSNQDICPGDSGGPLLIVHPHDPSEDIQIAVSMWAPNLSCNGGVRRPSVFTKVGPWIESIRRIIEKENGRGFKSIAVEDDTPYMLPDFELNQLEPVFLPSDVLLQGTIESQGALGEEEQGNNSSSIFEQYYGISTYDKLDKKIAPIEELQNTNSQVLVNYQDEQNDQINDRQDEQTIQSQQQFDIVDSYDLIQQNSGVQSWFGYLGFWQPTLVQQDQQIQP